MYVIRKAQQHHRNVELHLSATVIYATYSPTGKVRYKKVRL